MNRRQLMTGLVAAASWTLPARAEQAGKINFILWVSTEAQPDPFITGFQEGMRERGYVEGRDLAFALRYAPANPALLEAMLPEILSTPADLIVSSGPAILAMKAATARPVLFAISGDPVALGIAQSLARPGRNFTGSTFLSLELAKKRVELLRELLPDAAVVAVLSQSNHPGEASEHEATKQAADAFSLSLVYVPFASGSEIDAALERVRASGANAMLTYPDGVTMVHREKIAEFAKTHRLPSMFGWREYCDAGGLASYGASQRAVYRKLAAYADRLLRGETPGDLPIEQPATFELVFNARTAQALGLTIPQALLARADAVIE